MACAVYVHAPDNQELTSLGISRFRQEAIVRALKSSSVCLCVTQRPRAKEGKMRFSDKTDAGAVSASEQGATG